MANDQSANIAADVFTFAAFVSYSHSDEEIAAWLHRRLESYEVPRELASRLPPDSQKHRRLGKVFRDRADLSAAHDLGGEIREALQHSRALIVLCSPRSSGSKYVHEEIRYFKELGKSTQIFAAIVDGEPHAAGKPGRTAADECFPPALIYALGANRQISSTPEANEPIAADFRDGRDGRENGSLKIIAGLLDVGLDELVQRERIAERRRRRRANLVAGSMTILALGAVGAGGAAWFSEQRARVKEGEAVQSAADARRERNAAVLAREAEAFQTQRAQQEQQRAEQERDRADYNAEEARVQALAARRGEAEARNALARMFSERSWQSMQRDEYILAVRYAAAGMRIAPANEPEYRAALASALYNANESVPLDRRDNSEFSADGALLLSRRGSNLSLLDGATAREIGAFDGNADFAHFSPDGARTLVVSDNVVRIHDNDSRRELFRFSTDHPIKSASFNRRGDRLLTRTERSGAPAHVQLWNADGQRLQEYAGQSDFENVAFSADGSRFVLPNGQARSVQSSDDGRLVRSFDDDVAFLSPDGRLVIVKGSTPRLVNVDTGATVIDLAGLEVWNAEYSADGNYLAISAAHDVKVYDIRQRVELTALRSSGTAAGVDAAFSPDSRSIAITAEDGTISLWSLTTAPRVTTLRVPDREFVRLAFSSDSRTVIASAYAYDPIVFDAASGEVLSVLRGHEQSVYNFVVSSRGAVVTEMSGEGALRFWPSPRGHDRSALGSGAVVRSGAYSAAANRVAVATDDGVRIGAQGSDSTHILAGQSVMDVSFSRDGAYVSTLTVNLVNSASGNIEEIGYWNAVTGQSALSMSAGERAVAVAAEAAMPLVLVVTAANTIQVREIQSGRRVSTLAGAPIEINAALFSRDGSRILAYGDDRAMAVVWDARTGARIGQRRTSSEMFNRMAFSDDAAVVVSSNFGDFADAYVVDVWAADGGSDISQLEGHSAIIDQVLISPDGRRILTQSAGDNTIRLWDARSGDVVVILDNRGGSFTSSAFSPDSSRVVFVARGAAHVLDAESGRELATLARRGMTIGAASFTADGARILTGADDGATTLWDVTRLTQPMSALLQTACHSFLPQGPRYASGGGRGFRREEVDRDPLIRAIWVPNGRQERDVCEGVPHD